MLIGACIVLGIVGLKIALNEDMNTKTKLGALGCIAAIIAITLI